MGFNRRNNLMERKMKIGAWSGLSALNNVKETINLCTKYQIDLLDIMINDGSREGAKFKPYKSLYYEMPKILNEYKSAGLELVITTWIQPNDDWLSGLEHELIPFLIDNNIGELTLDIEESWINQISRMPQLTQEKWDNALANALYEFYSFGAISITCQVSRTSEIESLLENVPHQIIPQAYSTANSVKKWPGTAPGKLQDSAFNKFKKWAGPHMAEKRLIMGLAAYNQDGISGLSEKEAVQKCMDSCRVNGIDEVRFWRLETINSSIYKGYMSK